MGRRRLQQKGELRNMGGMWKGRWREDQILDDNSMGYEWGPFVEIGPSTGPNKMTKPEARREFWKEFLSKLDEHMRTPHSVLTVNQFVERRFVPEHVAMMKPGGRKHYEAALKYVLHGIPAQRFKRKGVKMVRDLETGRLAWPAETGKRLHGIGKRRIRDIGHEDVQKLVSEAIQRGLSVQTARHIKNCVSAIFTFAEEVRWFNGRNPAKHVRLPEMTRRAPRALTFDELKALLAGLKPMARAMVLCASLTSMNIAEVCGLRWKRVNLTADPVIVDGESIPAFHAAVREQWYLRQWGSVKAAARRRNLPLTRILVDALIELRSGPAWEVALVAGGQRRTRLHYGPDDPIFSGEAGRPVDQTAMLNRQVRKAAAAIGAPKLGWHDLRRTFATLADQLGMTMGERQALMGHSRAMQTMAYTHTPGDLAMAALDRLGDKVKGAVN